MSKEKTKLGKIIEAVAGTADKIITGGKLSSVIKAITGDTESTVEEKEQMLKELDILLKDTQNARDNETARDTSDNAPWISKIIHELIAIMVVSSWIISWWLPAIASVADPRDAVMLILGYLYGRTKPQK